MNEDVLTAYARDFCKENFKVEFNIPLRISSRMKTKLGAFVIKTKQNQVVQEEIVLSKSFIDNNQDDEILDVLYHECVHFCLYRLNKPYKDQDAYFKDTLRRLNISLTRTYMYKGILHHYQCPKCRYHFTKRMKGYEKRYICGRCHSKFKYIGQKNHA